MGTIIQISMVFISDDDDEKKKKKKTENLITYCVLSSIQLIEFVLVSLSEGKRKALLRLAVEAVEAVEHTDQCRCRWVSYKSRANNKSDYRNKYDSADM